MKGLSYIGSGELTCSSPRTQASGEPYQWTDKIRKKTAKTAKRIIFQGQAKERRSAAVGRLGSPCWQWTIKYSWKQLFTYDFYDVRLSDLRLPWPPVRVHAGLAAGSHSSLRVSGQCGKTQHRSSKTRSLLCHQNHNIMRQHTCSI